MDPFESYSNYYNLFYEQKDYSAEVKFIHSLLQEYAPGSKSILDLGCGTGMHDFIFAQKGFNVTGVDNSETMLRIARSSLSSQKQEQKRIEFFQGDIRHIELNRKFDAVISLFHVMSYQVRNSDVKMTFDTVRRHLKPGGVFVFDFWYGPAVLSEKPSPRMKKVLTQDKEIIRFADPEMVPDQNRVDVRYNVLIKDKNRSILEEITEVHHMRYFFRPEIEIFIDDMGFETLECGEWMTRSTPDFKTWSVYNILKLNG